MNDKYEKYKIDNNFLKNAFGADFIEEARTDAVDAERAVRLYLDGLFDRIVAKCIADDVRLHDADDVVARLDTADKVALFRKAQGWQALYESRNGINALIVDATTGTADTDWSRDALRLLRYPLDFNRPTLFTRW